MAKEKTNVSKVVISVFNVVKVFLMAALLVFFTSMFISGLKDCYRYTELHDSAVTVSAVVSDHREYTDSDDDTTYESYVTYVLNGKKHKNVKYQSSSSKGKLTDIGKTVKIKVSPEMPEEILENFKDSATTITVVFGGSLIIFLVIGVKNVLRKKSTKAKDGFYLNDDIVKKHLKEQIMLRKMRTVFVMGSLFFGFLYYRFPLVFSELYRNIAFFGVVISLVLIGLSVRDYIWVNKGDFEIVSEKAISKEDKSDDDSTTYYIEYLTSFPEQKVYKRKVEGKEYSLVNVNDFITAVYYSKSNKPKRLLAYRKGAEGTELIFMK